jgi:hypothetical protein
MIFLRGKLLDFIVLDKTYAIPVNIHTLMVTDAGNQSCEASNLLHWTQNDVWECFIAFR